MNEFHITSATFGFVVFHFTSFDLPLHSVKELVEPALRTV